ncbi:MarR family winged helix-turn-helix transcriptional regulator [Nocardia sp. NPDC051570]|uniref:MarR family winged helix-turn-helix transcriptional regulator n=1 Tax=Nocardia sp. NPDC051570 TaxID=3364324 RepID=UPI0037A250AF
MAATPHDPVDDLIEFIARSHGPQGKHGDLRAKSTAYRLRQVAHRLELEMRRELSRYGIDLWELELLAALLRAPGERLSAGQLMNEIQLTSGTVTHRVTRVQDRGWVRRDPDPADGRSVIVSLTEAGRRRALEVFDVKTDVERHVFAVLEPETLDLMNDALRRIAARLTSLNEIT